MSLEVPLKFDVYKERYIYIKSQRDKDEMGFCKLKDEIGPLEKGPLSSKMTKRRRL